MTEEEDKREQKREERIIAERKKVGRRAVRAKD
jgi:hypothetical protein